MGIKGKGDLKDRHFKKIGRYRTIEMIEQTYTFPIVFNVIEELKEELGFSSEDFGSGW